MFKLFFIIILIHLYGISAFEQLLAPRQSTGALPSDIPSQCNTICGPALSDAQTCGLINTTCLCSNSVRAAAVNCAVCIVKLVPSELVPLQEVADSELQLCQEAKLPVPAVNLTAILMGNNDTSSSSLGPSSTQTGPASSSSTTPGASKTNGSARAINQLIASARHAPIIVIALSLTTACMYFV